MEIFMVFPKSEKTRKEIQRTLARFQADQALKYIQKLPCAMEQKLELVDAAVKRLKGEENT